MRIWFTSDLEGRCKSLALPRLVCTSLNLISAKMIKKCASIGLIGEKSAWAIEFQRVSREKVSQEYLWKTLSLISFRTYRPKIYPCNRALKVLSSSA